jgi:Protein of unknown function (DUF1073)
MATTDIQGQQLTSYLGNSLSSLLMVDDLEPGDQPGYQVCKVIYSYHPLGAKMVDGPLVLAQSQARKLTCPKGPEQRLIEAFVAEWEAMGADKHILNTARLARMYGIASLAIMSEGTPPSRPIELKSLYKSDISFSSFDPLNTAGSMVLNQDPLSIDFLKVAGISVGGVAFHRSRAVVIQNEDPIYIQYTTSAFGFTGRSVYQRALFPLKSFIQTMLTDDLISYKAGVIIAKMKQPGSIVDQVMSVLQGVKRAFVKIATVGNIISIDIDEEIETINFQNLEAPFKMARKDILDNIATAADMPAVFLNQETFAEGFGEGTEDAKRVAQYINRIRIWWQPLYDWFDIICMHRAWNPDFYATIQKDFPEKYKNKGYAQAFYEWKNNFAALWPNLIEESDSDKVKVADVVLKAAIAIVEVTLPVLDPENKATLLEAFFDNVNAMKDLFSTPFVLDYEAFKNYVPPEELKAIAEVEQTGDQTANPKDRQPGDAAHTKTNAPAKITSGKPKTAAVPAVPHMPPPPKPFADSTFDRERVHRALDNLTDAVKQLPNRRQRHVREDA